MKSVLLSIQPKWCELIASGKKTVEIRKTKPKIETPFKCYIYCTLKGCKEFFKDTLGGDVAKWNKEKWADKKGKVIGEFICDEIINIKPFGFEDVEEFEKQTCLNSAEVVKYLNGFYGYGWRISDLVIYDKPKELREFKKPCEETNLCYPDNCNRCGWNILLRPPQSWCYVEEEMKK